MTPPESPAQMARMQGVLEPGSTFGVYIVRDCIGEGGMARIYRAEHAGLRRQVALKVLINGFAREPEGRERFVREARIAAAIKHPNVVNIFDVGVHENIPYLVMELLEGTDLESYIQTKGQLDESMIIDIMVPVVAGLAAVHEAGIVHRDLKPGNIFLARGRYEEIEPKLLDFGISKAPDTEQAKLTSHGLIMGTPFYMSPEGLRGEEMTPLSDQYSLGVVMYECVAGRAPFAPTTFPELVKQITGGQFLPPTGHNPVISKRLERIILRAMSLEPERRYADFREMGRELLLLAGQRTRITWGLSFGERSRPSTTSAVIGPDSIPHFRHPWRKKAPIAALLLALLVVVGVAVSGRMRGGPSAERLTHTTSTAAALPASPHLESNIPAPPPEEPTPDAVAEPPVAASPARSPAAPARPARNKAKASPVTRADDQKSSTENAGESAKPAVKSVSTKNTTANKVSAATTVSGANGAPIFD